MSSTSLVIRIIGITSLLLSVCCTRQHHLDWETGMSAWGQSALLDPDSVMFNTVSWENLLHDPAKRFSFSVRMPDRIMLRPDELTLEVLDSYGAEEVYYEGGSGRRIRFPNGWILVYVDAKEGLEVVSVNYRAREEGSAADCGIAVGDTSGGKVVCLPAKRDDLVTVFGEPEFERSRIPALTGI